MRRASWFNIVAVALGLAFLYLPIVILVIYSFNASRLVTVWGGWSLRWYAALLEDRALLEAASDLGASPLRVFWLVTFPLSLPGVGAGALLCFIPIVGEFVIPDLLAGSGSMMIGQTLWLEFFTNKDWPVAAAAAVALLVLLVPPLLLYDRLQRRQLGGAN